MRRMVPFPERFRPSTHKVPKDISEDAKAAFEKRPRPPELPPKKKPTPKKQKPTGRKPLPKHLEAETHELTPTVCASRGNVHLDMGDVIVETKLHVVKLPVDLMKHVSNPGIDEGFLMWQAE